MLDQDMQCTDFNDIADRCERTARLLELASDALARGEWHSARRFTRLAAGTGGGVFLKLARSSPADDTEAIGLMARTHNIARALRRDAEAWRELAREETLRAMH